MPYISSHVDGARLHYLDFHPTIEPQASGPSGTPSKPASGETTLVFLHSWPMSSLMYEQLMLPLCEDHRVRCVALDRRGFGKSDWNGSKPQGAITYETFANDTVGILQSLDIDDFVFVAASMGCGESVLAYKAMDPKMREKCKGFIWLGPSLPFPLHTADNPAAPPRQLWNAIVAGLRQDRGGFVHASLPGVFGIPVGIQVSNGVVDRFEYIVQEANALAVERCVQIITEKNFRTDLEQLAVDDSVQVLVIHGDSDQSAPFEATAKIVGDIMPKAEVKMYEKAAHGLYATHATQVIDEILGFLVRSAK